MVVRGFDEQQLSLTLFVPKPVGRSDLLCQRPNFKALDELTLSLHTYSGLMRVRSSLTWQRLGALRLM